MHSVPDFLIRSLRPDDTDAIVGLYEAASARDINIGPITAAQWTDFVQRPHNKGGQDFRVAVQDNQLIGLAESSLRDQDGRQVRFFKLVIDPSRRRQGVGTALLKELLALNARDSALSFQTLAASDWRDGLAFLERLGFLHIESEITMRCLSLSAQTPVLPDAVVVERIEAPWHLAAEVADLHNAAFALDVAFRSYSVGEMQQILAEEGQVLWVVRDHSRILGYCRMECEPGLIWLEQIAIDLGHQSRGLGMAPAYGALQAAGIDHGRPAGLNVSSVNGKARSMYRKLGFAIRREVRRYSVSQLDLIGRMAIAR